MLNPEKKINDPAFTGLHLSEIADMLTSPGDEEEIVNEQEQTEVVNEEESAQTTNANG